ncbi:MAG: hypothetical protein HYR64_07610 [Fimbriimonas ginsengisoli]|uniref:Flagellar FliJ protein n=1 Tax=Fimbriimonas ginsengisoli TaxID=1005039 RepID=A0A931LY85_FIMGI|nr:hypothetical protein [Fimbriimonas ginsengisoli]
MKQFRFRLERVLEYRSLVEKWAKDAYMAARLATAQAEIGLEGIAAHRHRLLFQPVEGLNERRALELTLQHLDDQQQDQEIALGVLRDEEAATLAEWQERRKDLHALEHLRDEALIEWKAEERHEEQKALDDWTSSRRPA